MAKPWHNFTPRKPTKAQTLAARNWQAPLDADATALVRKKPRRFREDAVPELDTTPPCDTEAKE